MMIRKRREKSITGATKQLGINRKTVRKYMNSDKVPRPSHDSSQYSLLIRIYLAISAMYISFTPTYLIICHSSGTNIALFPLHGKGDVNSRWRKMTIFNGFLQDEGLLV